MVVKKGRPERDLIRHLPNLLTLLGLFLRLAYLKGDATPVVALIGTLCDVLDGWTARRWGLVSTVGARLDWYSDVACATYALTLLKPYALPLLVVLWTVKSRLKIRVSGAAFLIFLVWVDRAHLQ